MPKANVIQGCFPRGIGHLSRGRATVQPHARGAGTAAVLPPEFDRAMTSQGRPLPAAVRQRAEEAFGTSFADVRVHVGEHVSRIGAVAFTSGSDIHIAEGHYDPNTPHGQRILVRELTHVVQQRAGRVQNPFGSGVAVVHDAVLEAEADRFARRAATVQRKTRGGVVQRIVYKSTITDSEFVVTHSAGAKRYYRMYATSDRANDLAYIRYSWLNGTTVCYEHIEALNMPREGTRAGYFLLWLAAKDAIANGRTISVLGTPVVRDLTERNLKLAEEAQDDSQIRPLKGAQAAVHVYEYLGFDVSSVVSSLGSSVATSDVRDRAHAKATQVWMQREESKCFLTTACVEARGLPDNCEELAVLRRFRDSHVAPALVEHYYDVAPRIVAAIDAMPERQAVLDSIYAVVRACADSILRGDHDDALRRYSSMVRALERELG